MLSLQRQYFTQRICQNCKMEFLVVSELLVIPFVSDSLVISAGHFRAIAGRFLLLVCSLECALSLFVFSVSTLPYVHEVHLFHSSLFFPSIVSTQRAVSLAILCLICSNMASRFSKDSIAILVRWYCKLSSVEASWVCWRLFS